MKRKVDHWDSQPPRFKFTYLLTFWRGQKAIFWSLPSLRDLHPINQKLCYLFYENQFLKSAIDLPHIILFFIVLFVIVVYRKQIAGLALCRHIFAHNLFILRVFQWSCFRLKTVSAIKRVSRRNLSWLYSDRIQLILVGKVWSSLKTSLISWLFLCDSSKTSNL